MKELQKKVNTFSDKHNANPPIEHRVLDLLSELGEVAKKYLKMTDYGKKRL